jgi:glycosyltransferase involved in cell wall biosynthesis
MGYLIKNITYLLSKSHRCYNKEIQIQDEKKTITINPREEYYIYSDNINTNIKRLTALNYIQYSYLGNNNQIVSLLDIENERINKKNELLKNNKNNFKKKDDIIKPIIKNDIKIKNINNNENKLVSVIIVNYNCGDYIERAIKSVLNQTYSNIELLIVDDNSTDNSVEVIKKYLNDNRVTLYKSNVNMGPYWAKNTAIQKCSGDYITMVDADDYDIETRIEEQVNVMDQFDNVYVVTCSIKRDDEPPCLGYPSMMWRKEVFEKIGYYDYVRFAADSEFFDRFNKVYKKSQRKHIGNVLQMGTRRNQGLTSIYPERSNIRKEYINQYTKWHNQSDNLYIEFPLKKRKFDVPDEMIIKKRVSFSNIEKINPEKGILPVIMCVWKRVEGFDKIIKQLNNQDYKNFKLFIWNNNTELKHDFENILKKVNFNYEIMHSETNIGGFGRFYYASKIRRKPGYMDYCVFIDDDQTFNNNLLTTFISEIEPKTIKSQWGWKFNGLNYYKNRVNVKPGEEIHYAGTGGMVADMRVFEDEELYSCDEKYWFVEDLWLSYFANKIHGYKLVKSSAFVKNGDDEHSLYKRVLDVKTPMLNYLINKLKWDIIDDKSITIIIPTFNNVDYIDECINSIKNNSKDNINIQILIGIDDCEKTKNHIKNNVLYNDVESYYFNVNVGPYIIKNTLTRYAKYENILFFDSDDYFLNETIPFILNGLNNSEYVIFKYQNIKNNRPTNMKYEYGEGVFGIKKDVFIKQNGFYPWRCAGDSEFKDRYKTKNTIHKIDKLCFNRRIHDNSLTKSKETGYNSDIRLSYAKKISENKKNNYPNPNILYTEQDHYKL